MAGRAANSRTPPVQGWLRLLLAPAAHIAGMTTSQNRQPKGIITGGQFAPDIHTESTLLLDPAGRPVYLAPGDGDAFPELADGEVIETLNVSRSQVTAIAYL